MSDPATRHALGALPWVGETVVIVASGPSAAGADLEAVRGRAKVVVINDSWRLAPWADVLYACDPAWWRRPYSPHRGWPDTFAFEGLRVTQDLDAARQFGLRRVVVQRGVDRILVRDPGVVGSGGNGGFQALNIAVQSGARRIVLVGYDMTVAGGVHWHGRHPSGLNNPTPGNVARWAAALDAVAPTIAALGVSVVNASPISALAAYPKMTLEAALDGHGTELHVPARRDLADRLRV